MFMASALWLFPGPNVCAQEPAPTPQWNIPVGGQAVSLPDRLLLCETVDEPFAARRGQRSLLPSADLAHVGKTVPLRLATSLESCDSEARDVRATLTGPWPNVAPGSVTLYADEGRLSASGHGLRGSELLWRREDRDWLDACHEPSASADGEQCEWAVTRRTTASPEVNRLAFLPAAAKPGRDALYFDARGQAVALDPLFIKPAKVVIERIFPVDASVDLSSGSGMLELLHPEAVGSVRCAPLSCELHGAQLSVIGGARPVEKVEVSVQLRPHVVLRHDDHELSEATGTAIVTACPMSIVSGEPFRDADRTALVVKLEGLCASDVSALRFEYQQRPLTVARVVHDGATAYVLLQLGAVRASNIAVTAIREGKVAVAVAHSVTRAVPTVRASLSLPGFPNVDFVPTNRWANVHIVVPAEDLAAVALPVEGIYEARVDSGQSLVRGNRNASGLTTLQFALRNPSLPGPLAQSDLAVVPDVVLRPIREANVPAELAVGHGGEGDTSAPLVELLCGFGEEDGPQPVPMGTRENLAFGQRDTCRVLFHRERLKEAFGTQRIRLEIDVYDVDGRSRGDAHVAETLTLRHGEDPREAHVHGVLNPFDRLSVRIRHEADESHYLGASDIHTGTAAVKWTVVFGAAHARLYATTAFPTGLYRVSSHDTSGLLSLNFGILSRLTWLDDEGNEGFLGIEAGLIVVGLGNAVTSPDDNLTQLGAVLGLGLSVPFANRSSSAQAAINVHAWFEVDLTQDKASASDGRLAFIFGPSISIGNLGTNL